MLILFGVTRSFNYHIAKLGYRLSVGKSKVNRYTMHYGLFSLGSQVAQNSIDNINVIVVQHKILIDNYAIVAKLL